MFSPPAGFLCACVAMGVCADAVELGAGELPQLHPFNESPALWMEGKGEYFMLTARRGKGRSGGARLHLEWLDGKGRAGGVSGLLPFIVVSRVYLRGASYGQKRVPVTTGTFHRSVNSP